MASSLVILFRQFQFHLLPLDQKFFFHAVRKDPIAGMSTMMNGALRGVFAIHDDDPWRSARDTSRFAVINPCDLQFSRGCFERLDRQER